MEHHILEHHIFPDRNNLFSCDECEFSCDEKAKLLRHHQNIHKDNINNANEEEDNEVHRLQKELKQLKNNFERLESVLKDLLDENLKIKSEYESRFVEANDKLDVFKAENANLQEKVEVLFKLGREYMDKYENKSPVKTRNGRSVPKGDVARKETLNEDEIETVTIEEVTIEEEETTDDLQAWSKNKLRGFKRTGPSTSSERIVTRNSQPNPPSQAPIGARKSPLPPASESPPKFNNENTKNKTERTMFCHFFSNLGKCVFEEKTGRKCKFVHGDAPVCHNGSSCTRNKCMFKHPNLAGRKTFLGRQVPQSMNPWMMMNPWWSPSQLQMPNPWMGINNNN